MKVNKAKNGDKNVAKMHDVAELTLLKGDVLLALLALDLDVG